jgi:hypothetical protein
MMRPITAEKYDEWLKKLKDANKQVASMEDIKQHPLEVVSRYLVLIKQKLGEKSLDYASMEPFRVTHDVYSLYVHLMDNYCKCCEFMWPEFVDNPSFEPFPLHFIHTVFKRDTTATEIPRYELFLNDEYQSVIENGFTLHENVNSDLLFKTHNRHTVSVPPPCLSVEIVAQNTGPARLEVADRLCNLSKDYLQCLEIFVSSFGKVRMDIVAIAKVINDCAFTALSTSKTIGKIDGAQHLVARANKIVCQFFVFASFLWWTCDDPLCYRTLLSVDALYHTVFRGDNLALLTYYYTRAVYALRFSPDKRDVSNMIEALIVFVAQISPNKRRYMSMPALMFFSSHLVGDKTLAAVWRTARRERRNNNDNNNNNSNDNDNDDNG